MNKTSINQPSPSRPVHEVRIGLIKAAVWANMTRDGMLHNVTFERRYHDGEGWKSSSSFGRDDLLKLAKVANEAHSWIIAATASVSKPLSVDEPIPPKPVQTGKAEGHAGAKAARSLGA